MSLNQVDQSAKFGSVTFPLTEKNFHNFLNSLKLGQLLLNQ